MNREHLYLGKTAITPEWVYGYLVKEHGDYYIVNQNYPFLHSPVVSETVREFTNFYNMEGKRLWENDIVERGVIDNSVNCSDNIYERHDGPYVIKMISGMWCLCGQGELLELHFESHGVDDKEVCCRLKTIGNFYDNPELLISNAQAEGKA